MKSKFSRVPYFGGSSLPENAEVSIDKKILSKKNGDQSSSDSNEEIKIEIPEEKPKSKKRPKMSK